MAQYKGAASEGNRAANLMKKRERAREELELMKMKISEVALKIRTIYKALNKKFVGACFEEHWKVPSN